MCPLLQLLNYILEAKLTGFLNREAWETLQMEAFGATKRVYGFCRVSFLWISQPISKACFGVNKKRFAIALVSAGYSKRLLCAGYSKRLLAIAFVSLFRSS